MVQPLVVFLQDIYASTGTLEGLSLSEHTLELLHGFYMAAPRESVPRALVLNSRHKLFQLHSSQLLFETSLCKFTLERRYVHIQ